jgi:5-methylcytosine-specific restriction enzyme B
MSIPSNITKQHLLDAIKKIDKEGIPASAASMYYDLDYNGKNYPPKLVVSYANLFANGEELDRNSFKGGLDTDCFKLLEKNGFMIDKKVKSFFDSIFIFVKQAQTNDLKTKHFRREFHNLKVEVSFGQGNPARIPWLALLRDGQAVSNGIYPVFLYYKEHKLLVLAYGLSETQAATNNWNLNSPTKTIHQLITGEFNSIPARYGDSFVHSYYHLNTSATDFGLNPKTIDKDLDAIVDIYKKLPLGSTSGSTLGIDYKIKKGQHPLFQKIFYNNCIESGLNFSDKLILRFIASLCTKPFVILTGLAGSGKTKLAQAFSQWICTDDSQVCIVPVGADWTNREPLLGFPNALDPTKYSSPENGALQLLIKANANPNKPYFLILDEMNLSHVERYFADFLSAMESHEPIPLHTEDSIQDIPKSILLPKNLFIIGTVNIDETTYMFSPKVLDRANAIEFRVTHDEMETYLDNPAKLNMDMLKARGADMAEDFVSKAKAESNGFTDSETLNAALLSFFRELKKVGAEFGYRTASEIKRFAEIIHTLEAGWTTEEIVDAAVMQKLLPKIHGSRRKIEPSLKALATLCLVQQEDAVKVMSNLEEVDLTDPIRIKYPLSLEKISRMYKAVVQDGFTSFAEA